MEQERLPTSPKFTEAELHAVVRQARRDAKLDARERARVLLEDITKPRKVSQYIDLPLTWAK